MKRTWLLVACCVSVVNAAEDKITVENWDSTAHAVATKMGQQALRINAEQWQHVQSAHFVLHSAHQGIAAHTAYEAEYYLTAVFGSLALKEFQPKRKAHIFIFERAEDWQQFTRTATLDPRTGGFFDGLDLFYRRHAGLGIRDSSPTLPHEIAHCALYFKFPFAAIPLTLNEGFAEYQSRKLAFQYLRPRGYDVRIISKRLPREQFVSAEKLLAATDYPRESAEKLVAFYDGSERLVNFLVEKHGPGKFLDLLEVIAEGQAAPAAVLKVYRGDFSNLADFNRQFEEFGVEEK